MSFLQIALITGNFLGGWLGDKLGNKKILLIASTVASIPAIWLIGQVSNIWQLATLTSIVWCFYLSIGINLNITLVGLLSVSKERGKVFSIFSVVAALAGLLAGLTFGPIADLWGYSTMFKFVCLFSCFFALSELFLEDKPVSNTSLSETITEQSTKKWSKEFLLMLIATLIMGLVSLFKKSDWYNCIWLE